MDPKTATLTETKRLVIDYRRLNEQIPKVQTQQAKSKGALALIQTANIDHLFSRLEGARFFSTIDIRGGYHHISIKPEDRKKTAFVTIFGKYEWRRASFGIQTAPSFFLNLMFKIFFPYVDKFLIFHMDDILVFSKTEEEHLDHLEKVFEKVKEANIKLKRAYVQ